MESLIFLQGIYLNILNWEKEIDLKESFTSSTNEQFLILIRSTLSKDSVGIKIINTLSDNELLIFILLHYRYSLNDISILLNVENPTQALEIINKKFEKANLTEKAILKFFNRHKYLKDIGI